MLAKLLCLQVNMQKFMLSSILLKGTKMLTFVVCGCPGEWLRWCMKFHHFVKSVKQLEYNLRLETELFGFAIILFFEAKSYSNLRTKCNWADIYYFMFANTETMLEELLDRLRIFTLISYIWHKLKHYIVKEAFGYRSVVACLNWITTLP